MKKADWKSIAELIGIGAIVASLIFVGLQLRQEQNIAIVDSYGSIVESISNSAHYLTQLLHSQRLFFLSVDH